MSNNATPHDGANAVAAFEAITGGAKGILEDAGIVFQDAADFLASEIPPPKWIVRDFIAVGMKGDLCGSSKTYKTYLGLLLAISIAAGRDFLAVYPISEPHVVAYVNLELFDWNFKERLDAQTAGGLGIEREALRDHLFVCNLRGRADTLRDRLDALVELLQEKRVEIVIIDPRYKLLKPGEDENTGDGLRGILELRDRLAEHFAALLVTHDPKGDTSQKETTDRGAGSYTAGADFDFRLTIDRAEGWRSDNLVYVVGAGNRARRTPPPIGVRFDEDAQTFRYDDTIAPVKLVARLGSVKENAEARAAKETAIQDAFREAALAVVCEAGGSLLDTTDFDNRVAKVKGASLGINRRGPMRKALVAQGVLACAKELERKPTGEVGNRKNGRTFISTPDRIDAYLKTFDGLAI